SMLGEHVYGDERPVALVDGDQVLVVEREMPDALRHVVNRPPAIPCRVESSRGDGSRPRSESPPTPRGRPPRSPAPSRGPRLRRGPCPSSTRRSTRSWESAPTHRELRRRPRAPPRLPSGRPPRSRTARRSAAARQNPPDEASSSFRLPTAPPALSGAA